VSGATFRLPILLLIKLGSKVLRESKTKLDLDLESYHSTKWDSMIVGDKILLVLSYTANGFSDSRLLVQENRKGQLA
jgi:hypothetical protein